MEQEEGAGVEIAEGSAIHMRAETGRWRKEWDCEACFVWLQDAIRLFLCLSTDPVQRVFLCRSKMRTYCFMFVHRRWESFGRSKVYLARVTEMHWLITYRYRPVSLFCSLVG